MLLAVILTVATPTSTSHGTNYISGTNGHMQFLFWNLDLWPMIIKLRCVSLDLIAIVFKSYGCVPSRGVRIVGERYFRCGKSWLFHQTHSVFIITKSYFMMAVTKRFLHINKNNDYQSKNLVSYLEQRYKVGHTNSLLARLPICGCTYLSLPLEQRRWQKRYRSCQGNGYVCRHPSWRSTSTSTMGVHSTCNHHETHYGCCSSCCLSKSKTKNESKKEILNKSNSFSRTKCPCLTKRTGHCAWTRHSFS